MKRNFILSFLVMMLCLVFTSCGSEVIADGATEYHHIFPRQFRDQFAEKGIDVDDFTIKLTKKDHRGIGTGLQYVPKNWNNEWNSWLQQNPSFTQADAEKQALKMLEEAKCRGEFYFYRYDTKELSNATVAGSSTMFVCSQNWFFNLCGKIGYWLLKILGGSKFGGQILSVLAAVGSAVLGHFGIKTEKPVAVGVGVIVLIVGVLASIGLFFFVKWIIAVIIGASSVVAASSVDQG